MIRKDLANTYKHNRTCLICSIVYLVMATLCFGWNAESLIINFLVYCVTITIALSPLGEKLFRRLQGVRNLETNKEKESLLPVFQEVYAQVKQKNPQLGNIDICIMDKVHVNACAMGKHTIAVTKGAMRTFTEDQLKGILAHEFSHILHYDTVATLYNVIGNGLFSIAILIINSFISLIDKVSEKLNYKTGKFICSIFLFILRIFVFAFTFIMKIILSSNSRRNEYRADHCAYVLGYGEELTDALYLLEQMHLNDNSNLTQKLMASHPRITARIEQLEALIENRTISKKHF